MQSAAKHKSFDNKDESQAHCALRILELSRAHVHAWLSNEREVLQRRGQTRKRVNELFWVNRLRKRARNQLPFLRPGRRQLVFTSPKEMFDQIGDMIEQMKERALKQ